MSKFNAGDKIVRVNKDSPWAPIGYETTVLKNGKYKDSDSSCKTGIVDEWWELVAPKWSRYNNDLPWEKLSNKKKGEFLLAELDGSPMNIIAKSPSGGDLFIRCEKINSSESVVYRARPEPVKPAPTMEELFIADWKDRLMGNLEESAEHMIDKGWTKPCK